MSAIQGIVDQVTGTLSSSVQELRKKVFGANNERLDFLMDSFYKLSPNQQLGVISGGVGLIGTVLLSIVILYFSRVAALKDQLEEGFDALHELHSLKSSYETENKSFEKLVDSLQKRARQTGIKPFFEKIANDLGVTIEGLSDQKVPMPADNPLADKVSEVRIDMRLPNISIPRLLSFVAEIEKSNRFLRIQDLQIRGRYGTKLYFDAQIKVRGYDVGS